MKQLHLILLGLVMIGVSIYLLVNPNIMEMFTSLAGGCSLVNAHGSKPPGFGESPGNVEETQNANALHVNPMYKTGNPQNVFPEFKLQPVF